MKVCVTGAGVSKAVGYPLGAELFDAIDTFIESCGQCADRFNYRQEWPVLRSWLNDNENPVIREAYSTKNLEHLFTVLDQASMLLKATGEEIGRAHKKGSTERQRAAGHYDEFSRTIDEYQKHRSILLWGLEQYLHFKHWDDFGTCNKVNWSHLHAFANKLCPGDVVITFNYDSALERVLLQQGQWSPRDGYGFEVTFQRSAMDTTPVEFENSPVITLHLHGACGWYRSDTRISLDPAFLEGLGITAVDDCLRASPPDGRQVFLHPSFLKDFEPQYGNTLLVDLWQRAAVFLREADEIFVIGYSLPKADNAALTLLLTSCDRNKLRIVNTDPQAHLRLTGLLSGTMVPRTSFEDWLRGISGCPDKSSQ
jgi:hypothetical protein